MTTQRPDRSLNLPVLGLFLSLALHVSAQAPNREPTPNDNLKSPEILDDRRVAFRLYAPKASDVSISGDWITQGLGSGGALTKDDRGVWSITVGPLPPDLYSYAFTVDGVQTIDPKNALIKQGVTSLDNLFLLPGPEAAFEENKPVPHGTVRLEWYQSSTLGTQRRMHVYVPPGYDNSRSALPVLYLLHGGGDEDSGWSTVGRAGFILDNLLAQKRAKPMIIVMPNGSLPRTNQPAFTGGTNASPEAIAAREAAQNQFTNELLNDVVPFVERTFCVLPDREHRALAGLSMGGGQTLRVLTKHPDQFAYVAIWSAGVGRNVPDFEQRNAAFFNDADRISQQLKLLALSAGDKDFALNGTKSLDELLNKYHIEHTFHTSEGGHTWINWRHYLNDLLPQLFR